MASNEKKAVTAVTSAEEVDTDDTRMECVNSDDSSESEEEAVSSAEVYTFFVLVVLFVRVVA